ncbi:MAG: 5-(carboxyamino)imidazole ribonucleotide synthase [Ignavibacteria bacterium]
MLLGVLGGGQLGRMLALAGIPLGVRCRFFDTSAEMPTAHVGECMVGDFHDRGALERFAQGLDVVTYEFENVPVEAARYLERFVAVYPPPVALETAQDRLNEKQLFERLRIPTPAFRAVGSDKELNEAVAALGVPLVVKTRRMGYDGKGQMFVRREEEVGKACAMLGSSSLLVERFVPFEREVSVLAVRAPSGAVVVYPLVENEHEGGILCLSQSPTTLSAFLQKEAEEYAHRILAALEYVGVLAIEFFVYEGRLIANEMAPRVHNSGHFTIEGSATSQFENHLRALLGDPLGATTPRGYAAMVNLIGTIPERARVLEVPGVHLHLYGKMPRPRRKLGHITITAETSHERDERVAMIRRIVSTS